MIVLVATAFDFLLGYGVAGVIVALVIAVALAFTSYFNSDKVALAVSRAKPADGPEYQRYHNLVEGLCIAAGLPKPRLYVIDDPAPNAFATGRNPKHAALAVTSGLLAMMNRVELEGVIAHELSHVKNYDILVSTIAVTAVGTIVLLSDIGMRFMWFGGRRDRRDNSDSGALGLVLVLAAFALLILAPFAAQLMQLSLSRNREYLADTSGVQLTRYPPGLISALEKLKGDHSVVHHASRATAQMWIEQPLEGKPSGSKESWLDRAFDTHPPLEDRIARLKEM
ncbi:MAG: Zn-dependent protease with chaperone function [Actinomycetia bacterium]|nr:Zn-dependent protease with chaperone function [Actinomycetes bacterium]